MKTDWQNWKVWDWLGYQQNKMIVWLYPRILKMQHLSDEQKAEAKKQPVIARYEIGVYLMKDLKSSVKL